MPDHALDPRRRRAATTALRRLAPHLRPLHGRAAGAALVVIVSPAAGAALLWLLKLVVDDVLVGGRLAALPLLCAGYLAAALAKFGLDYVAQRMEASLFERLVQDVRLQLYRHLVSLSPGSLGTRSVGDLLAHLSSDVERSVILLFSAPLSLVAYAASALFFAGLLVALSWRLTLLSLAVVPLLVWLVRGHAPRVRLMARIARRRASSWFAAAEEVLGALPAVQAFSAEGRETERLARHLDAARRAELASVAWQARLTLLLEVVVTLGGLLVLAAGAWEIHAGRLSLGAVVAFLGSVGSLYDPVRGLGQLANRFETAAAGADRVLGLLGAPALALERADARRLVVARGRIEFCGVSFAYPHGATVLHDVSFVVEPGQMLAIVGSSGSGKSTLARLLLRFHDPTRGAILVDGTDLRDVTLASIRRSVALVPQDPLVFDGSVADNIRYGRPGAAETEVVAAARAAAADVFIRRLRGGYGARIGPRGERLSGGQRQRLAVARALVRQAPILVLDEATAAIDSETEESIQASIAGLAGRRTIVVIGHRLATVCDADRVIVLEHGRIVEAGTPALLFEPGTRCHALFAAQLAEARVEA